MRGLRKNNIEEDEDTMLSKTFDKITQEANQIIQ